MSKKCFKCGDVKPLTEFYKHKQMGDGRLNKCKECCKKDVRANYRKNIDYYKEYDQKRNKKRKEYIREKNKKWKEKNSGVRYAQKKIRYKDLTQEQKKKKQAFVEKWAKNNKEKVSEYKKRWIENNAKKRDAHVYVGNAIRDGRIKMGPCQICGAKKVEAHHFDYSKKDKVIWLCTQHHNDIHFWLKYNKNKYK